MITTGFKKQVTAKYKLRRKFRNLPPLVDLPTVMGFQLLLSGPDYNRNFNLKVHPGIVHK